MKTDNPDTCLPETGSIESLLRYRTSALTERVKELNCLYGISNLFENEGVSLPWIMQRAVELIPSAWQYPRDACARIILDDAQYVTSNFMESAWRQSEDITVNGRIVGSVSVFYRKTDFSENPFLPDETRLLRAISERLGKVVLMKQAEEYLKESEERYRILTESVGEGVTLIQDGRFCYANPAFMNLCGLEVTCSLIGKPVSDPSVEGATEIMNAIKEADSGGARVFQILESGKSRWFQVCHNPITFRGRPALLSNFRDISDIKEREIAASRKAETLQRENLALRSSIKERYRFGPIIGKSAGMQDIYELILKAGTAGTCVAIYGESGTGKELVARAIHDQSARKRGKFVTVNCGAIPETIFEREFFGNKKGAFSGAHADSPGLLDLCNGGTLFLDEVGELTINMQVKLLRAIEGGGYSPVGSTEVRDSDFTIISASNIPLIEKVRSRQMRNDFFYRIQVIQINLPPLRERREDIPLLVEYFLKEKGHRFKTTHVPGRVFDILAKHDWPGNVRELRNALQRYLTIGRLELCDLTQSDAPKEKKDMAFQDMRTALEELEKDLISKAIRQTSGNRTKAAQLLGISRRALFRKEQK